MPDGHGRYSRSCRRARLHSNTEMRQPEPVACQDCHGTRAVPDDFGRYEDGYGPCPSCVINASETFVIYEDT